MAKNYTFAEAVRIINAGTDMESITDIGRRYPILMHKVATVCAKAGDAFVDLMSYMPEYLTANKVNTALKNTAGETEAEDTDADESAETEATEETTEAGAQDFESMSAKQMWDLLGKAGKRKLAKSTKKADLVEACKQAFGAGATAEDEAEAETEEAETEANPYDGKSAMELFKECKKRGIKAAPKKTAKFYADLLVKNDAEASAETETESDDWDEDEAPAKDEEPKAKKGSKKAEKAEEKKPAKKAAKKEETADDDDDWDI